VLVKEGDIVPGNSHFDTTKGHIEFRKAIPVDCTVDIAKDLTVWHPFKGNVDTAKLEEVLKNNPREKISCIIVTITNNTAGGQPVSMANLRETGRLAQNYGVKFFLDSARFAENAWFIKTREEGYADKSIREIVREMFSYADGMTMSSKKDAIVNMGGFTAYRDEELYKKASAYNIIYEGFITYGGMSGRDMNALAQGLYEGTEEPFGGHAIFIDAKRFLPQIPDEEFPGQVLAVELYIEGGIRSSEIGALMADRDPVTRENRHSGVELVRLAVPRRVYTDRHMDYVAAVIRNVYERKDSIKRGLRITKEAPFLRHFSIELERL